MDLPQGVSEAIITQVPSPPLLTASTPPSPIVMAASVSVSPPSPIVMAASVTVSPPSPIVTAASVTVSHPSPIVMAASVTVSRPSLIVTAASVTVPPTSPIVTAASVTVPHPSSLSLKNNNTPCKTNTQTARTCNAPPPSTRLSGFTSATTSLFCIKIDRKSVV